jgi:hypothetical protein
LVPFVGRLSFLPVSRNSLNAYVTSRGISL